VSDDAIVALPAPPSGLGESPFWHPDEQALWWCDIPGRALHRFDPASGAHRAWAFDSEPACCAPLPRGELLLARRDGLWRFSPGNGALALLAAPPYDPAHERFNDGKADPQGRLWVGTIYEPRQPPLASLHRFEAGRLDRMAEGITVSNGLAFSPDGRTMYWSDTTAHTIYAFDFEVRLPVRCPTMPCFGGADLRTLYVTTARHNRPADELAAQPDAGRVLSLRVDVPGLPVNFARL